MSLGYLTEAAADTLQDGGAMPSVFYAQQHTAAPGPTFDDNIGTDTRRIGPLSFAASVAGARVNSNAEGLTGAPADDDLVYLTLWDDDTAGACWWVVPLDGAPVAVIAGQDVGVDAGDITLALDIWAD